MGRAPCCSKVGLLRGPWSPTEDTLLIKYIEAHGEGQWRSLPKEAGLLRCGKSCRFRWVNYLQPGIKRGDFAPDEDDLIIRLHSLLGNRWSLVAGRLPGRTDNEIKNYRNTHLSRRLKNTGIDPTSHKEAPRLAPKPKERTRITSNTTRKDHPRMTNKRSIANGPMRKTKVYIPKPIRLSPFSSFSTNKILNNPVSQSSSNGEVDDKGIDNAELSNPPSSWFELNGASTADGEGVQRCDEDNDHDLFSGCDPSLQCLVPTNDNMLEKLYDEYLQLL